MTSIPNSIHPVQLYLYSHDITSPPFPIKLFISKPKAVYQPRNENEILEILNYARDNRLNVIPRGAGTSGYGGVLPYSPYNSIIIDFFRMKEFEIDEKQKILIAEPGVVWWDVERELNKVGLSLRVYPTSAPASTIAGWISAGGYGVGSLRYGGIAENVERLRIADFSGVRETEDIHLFSGLHGTTGIITKAWIKLKEYEEYNAVAFHVSIDEAVKLVENWKNYIYSAFFLSSEYITAKNQVFRDDVQYEVPEKDTLVIVGVENSKQLLNLSNLKIGNPQLGEHLWDLRFYSMRVKRLGPTLIISEVILPYNSIPEYVKKMKKMGAMIEIWFNKNNVTSLSFFLADERKVGYTLAWRKSIKAMKLAYSLGGKAYSTGLYLAHHSPKVIEEYYELLNYKKKIDPLNLLNYGKVFPKGRLPTLMKIAELIS